MPIGSIITDKELASTYQPMLLAVVTFSDGTIARYATHAVTYAGNAYQARILNQELAATQALSEQGIDIPASVNLRLADADYTIWNNEEKLHGFKGAKLELRAVMYDVAANAFSSDSRIIFRGICREPGGKLPTHDGKALTVGFFSRLGMADIQLPTIRVQRTCPWSFPTTAQQRQDGADNSGSEFFRCGYSPDATGGNERGNLDGGVPFTKCDFTKAHCVERGMYTKDSLNRQTGRFGGIQWSPPQVQTVREYVSGKWATLDTGGNEARYGDFIPLLYGVAWCDPLIVTRVPDGNYLKMEALICFGQVDYIHEVIVNDVKIPHTFNDSHMPDVPPGVSSVDEALLGGFWSTVNRGDRDGSPNAGGGWTDESGVPQGDPFGSYCVIVIVVPRKLADVNSNPRVRVLARRGGANPDNFDNGARHLQQIIQEWGNWTPAEINSGAFDILTSACDDSITYTDHAGNPGMRKRFTSSLYIRQRESLADIVRGIRNNCRALLAPDTNGLLAPRMKRTLADQQLVPVTGSNYNTPIASMLANGTPTNGYAAYRFDESNILEGPTPSVITGGNKYSVQFQNADNRWSTDVFNPIDSEDIVRSDQEIPGSFTLRGADNFDQLHRLVATYNAEQNRGNWRDDSGGTLSFDIVVSFRAVHLAIGDICLLNWEPLGIADQLVRITRIQPETNFERARLTLTWHEDNWYLDAWGQKDLASFAPPYRNRLARPSFAWLPFAAQPPVGDGIFDPSDWGFAILQRYEQAADGTAIAKVGIGGRQIVNVTTAKPQAPFVPIQGTTASIGGTIPGGRAYSAVIVAKNAGGQLSSLSGPVTIGVPAGTNTNTITIPDITWADGTAGYVLFAGTDPNKLSAQAEAVGTPASLTLTSLSVATWGAPDGEFDRYRIRGKRLLHDGVWGAEVQGVTSTTLVFAPPVPGFDTDQWAGYDIVWLGRKNDATPLPIANFPIASNDSTTLTLALGAPDPVALGVEVGDVFVMRCNPTFGTDGGGQYLEDPGWQNAFHPGGATNDETGFLIRFIGGTGRGHAVRITSNTITKHYGEFPFTPDSTSRYWIEEPNWTIGPYDSDSINNSDPLSVFYAEVDVNNYLTNQLAFQVLTVDGGNTESNEASSPIREIYLYGSAGATTKAVGLQIQVNGLLGIGSDQGPIAQFQNEIIATAVEARVKQAPVGADLVIDVNVGGAAWLTVTIPAGTTSGFVPQVDVDAAGPITGGDNISVDITAAGTTFPGADLSIFIYT